MQVGLLLHKAEQQAARRALRRCPLPATSAAPFSTALPFELTSHQLEALDELEADLREHRADAPAAAGRRGLGQDRRRPLLPRARRRGRVCRARSWRRPRRWPCSTPRRRRAWSAALAPAELLTASLTAQRAARGARAPRERARRGIVVGTHALLQEDVALRRPRACWSSTSSTASASSSATRWCAAPSATAARRTCCT